MTSDNYARHLKVLGKLCKLYDTAGASVTDQNTLIATTADQIATGLSVDNPAAQMFGPFIASLIASVTGGPTQIQALCKQIASQYLSLDLFYSSLTTVPTDRSAIAALVALQTECGAGVDNKTFTTKASTGLLNFFDAILGAAGPGTWNNAVDGSADEKDSVYVVSAVV